MCFSFGSLFAVFVIANARFSSLPSVVFEGVASGIPKVIYRTHRRKDCTVDVTASEVTPNATAAHQRPPSVNNGSLVGHSRMFSNSFRSKNGFTLNDQTIFLE